MDSFQSCLVPRKQCRYTKFLQYNYFFLTLLFAIAPFLLPMNYSFLSLQVFYFSPLEISWALRFDFPYCFRELIMREFKKLQHLDLASSSTQKKIPTNAETNT